MEKGIGIVVMGHEAKIASVNSRQADGIWYKEDFLMVFIDLGEGVEGISGFGINLPVKRYGKDEFIAAAKAEAENTLPKLLEKHRQEHEKAQRQREGQEALDLVVGEICSELGLEK